MQIVNWQSVLTDHQAHTLSALGRMPTVTLTVVVGREELPERKVQGWIKPDMSGLNVVSLDCSDWFVTGKALIRSHPNSMHLFNGLWADRRLFLLLLYVVWRGCKVGLVTEPFSDTVHGYLSDQRRLKGWLLTKARILAYGLAGKLLGRKIGPLFAISPKAVRQFASAGFSAASIYPYGYFVPAGQHSAAEGRDIPETELRLVFVGALIERKGIDVLGRAAALCHGRGIPFRLDLYGPGEPDLQLMTVPNIRYCGTIPFGRSQEVIAGYDALVVPSRYDGWGVVVNEALLQGVPVLASLHAGASALVAQCGAGAIFDPSRAEELCEIVDAITTDRSILVEWKRKARNFAPILEPEIAATYLLQCIESYLAGASKPGCPWYSMDAYAESS